MTFLSVDGEMPLRDQLHDCERQLVALALSVSNGRVNEAASRLGIHRGHLHRRMKALGLTVKSAAQPAVSADPVDVTLGDLEQRLRAREAGGDLK